MIETILRCKPVVNTKLGHCIKNAYEKDKRNLDRHVLSYEPDLL